MPRLVLGLTLSILGGCGGNQSSPHSEPSHAIDLDLTPQETRRRERHLHRIDPHRARYRIAPSSNAPPQPTQLRGRRFRGKRIDIDLKDAELHDVFRLLADVSGVNIVVSGDVAGTITLRLRRTPWDQVLQTVVELEGLELRRRSNVWLITRKEKVP